MRDFVTKHPGYSTRYVKRWREKHPEDNANAAANYRAKPESKASKDAGQRARRAADPVGQNRWWLKTKYGITPDDYNRLLAKQGGVCAICKGPPISCHRVLTVDHDHATGKVRGLLCFNCNIGLGTAQDSITILQAMIDYLTLHTCAAPPQPRSQ